jgi:hypothetical protein
MVTGDPANTLRIPTLEEFRRQESAVLARLGSQPIAAQLMVIDPLKALRMVGVILEAPAVEAWQAQIGDRLPAVSEDSFRTLSSRGGLANLEVTFRAIFPRQDATGSPAPSTPPIAGVSPPQSSHPGSTGA